jgi:uncharacterized protein (TIGR03435 family)
VNRFVFVLYCIVTVASVAAQQPAPAFELASIKRNLDPKPMTSGTIQNTPKGEIRLVAVPARVFVLRAYPVDVPGAEVVGLPSWATAERYDVTVRGNPDATPDEVRQMWRTLLADRMKLAAHYESREVRGYKLVVARADGRLGPELKPSTLDCRAADVTKPAPPPPQAALDALKRGAVITADTERLLRSQCRILMSTANTTYAGAVTMQQLVSALRFGGITEPIEDQTGLEGLYSFKLTFARPTLSLQPTVSDEPSIFVAVQEQLGLKLERTTMQSQAVVVDHIERPTEN